MAKYRAKDEKLKRMRLGSRYFGFNLSQFYWECLKLVAASEGLTETDLLRRIIRSWSETLPPGTQEKAGEEATRVETWKALAQAALKKARQIGGEAKWVTTA
jgi:hypothetical protein